MSGVTIAPGFKKAERKQIKIKVAMTGPSGSGKTYSALAIASGMGKKIALIDTENGSASLYSDKFSFDVLDLAPPFTTEKYIEAIKQAAQAGYEVLVIDSLTHAWAGEGGLLEQKEKLDSRGGRQNNYTNWAAITVKHEAFKSAILQSPIHVIATMRSKQEYVLETDKNGKTAPKKAGMAPIQRDGLEYDFSIVFDLVMNHEAQASKDRTGIFDQRIFLPSKETGAEIMKWIASGAPMPTPKTIEVPQTTHEPQRPVDKPPAQVPQNTSTTHQAPRQYERRPGDNLKPATENQRNMIWTKIKHELKYPEDQAKAFMIQITGKQHSSEWNWGDVDKIVHAIENEKNRPKTESETLQSEYEQYEMEHPLK